MELLYLRAGGPQRVSHLCVMSAMEAMEVRTVVQESGAQQKIKAGNEEFGNLLCIHYI